MTPFREVGFLLFAGAVAFQSLSLRAQLLTITTFAGPADVRAAIDAKSGDARFNSPHGLAADGNGNVFVADTSNHSIRRVGADGTVTTIAGMAIRGAVDGRGGEARFNRPMGVTVDVIGNVYIADSGNCTIRKITPGGDVTTVAGLARVSGSADGKGSVARFGPGGPTGIAADLNGNLYIADRTNRVIRKISADGEVTTLAGVAGVIGGADGIGTAATFESPTDVAVDSLGNVYVADASSIRKISVGAVVTTWARTGFTIGGLAVDGSADVYASDVDGSRVYRISGGRATILAGVSGSGSDDGTGSAARFRAPTAIAVDRHGRIFIADTGNNTIRSMSAAGAVVTLAGLAETGSSDGVRTSARFRYPEGVAIDDAANVYVADTGNHTIRRVTPGGVVTTLAGTRGEFGMHNASGRNAQFSSPTGLATDGRGNVYVADSYNDMIRKVTPGGEVSSVAGHPEITLFYHECHGGADGNGRDADFCEPQAVATDNRGNVYVADTGNHTIRRITSGGFVTTLAGLAQRSGSVDGIGSAARFNVPRGITVDSSGTVYVADTENHTIRKISAFGVVTTVAGLAGAIGSADGVGSEARFSYPWGIVADASGNLYVSDKGNDSIRRISSTGEVTTLAGLSGSSAGTDGTGSGARFYDPTGIAIDRSGNLYIADTTSSTIRKSAPSIADSAIVDVAAADTYLPRQLETDPRTADSWEWTVIRRPADSTAEVSSSTSRNPMFTPDRAGLFTLRLISKGATGVSITTVDVASLPLEPQPRRRAASH